MEDPEAAFNRKADALLKIVKKHPASKAIVFCSKVRLLFTLLPLLHSQSQATKSCFHSTQIETCRKVENLLRRRDRKEEEYSCIAYHSALSQDKRVEALDRFLRTEAGVGTGNRRLFLICTDR